MHNAQAVQQQTEALSVHNGSVQVSSFQNLPSPTPANAIVQFPAPRIRSEIYGPSVPSDPLIVVVPSILKEVLNFISITPASNFLSFLNLLVIDHGTLIPTYFNDQHLLIHLAFLLSP